jgi:hypothetical protein
MSEAARDVLLRVIDPHVGVGLVRPDEEPT